LIKAWEGFLKKESVSEIPAFALCTTHGVRFFFLRENPEDFPPQSSWGFSHSLPSAVEFLGIYSPAQLFYAMSRKYIKGTSDICLLNIEHNSLKWRRVERYTVFRAVMQGYFMAANR
jgi:hypothetical protein